MYIVLFLVQFFEALYCLVAVAFQCVVQLIIRYMFYVHA